MAWRRAPADHPLRVIREIVNATLAAISAEFDALYSPFGRESIPPERLSRALLLQAFYTTRSERQLVERLNFDLLFRWWLVLASRVLSWVMPRESRAGLCRAGARCART
jgi:transposase